MGSNPASMTTAAQIADLLARLERGETSARLDAAAGEPAQQLNRLLDLVEEARGWREVYPRELALAQQRHEELLRVLSAIRRLSDVLCTARTPEEICAWAAEVLAEELEFEHACVLLYDRQRDDLRLVAASDRKPVRTRRYSAHQGPLGRAFGQSRPTIISGSQAGFQALAPLRVGEERLGLIRLARPLSGRPTRQIEHGLVLLAAVAAQMLKTVELKRRLGELNQGLGREVEQVSAASERRARELEQMGALLDQLIDTSDRAVFIFERSGRLLRVNQAAATLLGRPVSQLLGRRLTSLLPKEERRALTAALSEWLQGGTALLTQRLSVRLGSGRRLDLDVQLRKVDSSNEAGLCLALARPSPVRHEAAPEPEAKAPCPAAPKRLLIIDDEVSLLESLQELLSCHHQVTVATSAQEGVLRAESEPFDLVLTDLGLPGMNGRQVAERIKAANPATPVGVMTGWGGQEQAEDLKAHGVDFILHKPFALQEILDCVEAVCPAA